MRLSTTNKLRISLSERNSEIKGTVNSECDAAFALESVSLVIQTLAKKFGVTDDEFINDVYVVLKGKVR